MTKYDKAGAEQISVVFGTLDIVLTHGFLDIFLTTSSAVLNFGNTEPVRAKC